MFARRDLKIQKQSKDVTHDKDISIVTVMASQLIVTAGFDHLVKIWHAKSDSMLDGCELKRKIAVSADVKALKYCPKSGVLAVSCSDGSVHVYHVKISQLIGNKNDNDDFSIDENDIDIADLDDQLEESKADAEVKSVQLAEDKAESASEEVVHRKKNAQAGKSLRQN